MLSIHSLPNILCYQEVLSLTCQIQRRQITLHWGLEEMGNNPFLVYGRKIYQKPSVSGLPLGSIQELFRSTSQHFGQYSLCLLHTTNIIHEIFIKKT